MRTLVSDVREELGRQGRPSHACKILMAVMPFIGESRAEAEDKQALHNSLVDPRVGLSTLAAHANADFSSLPLDATVDSIAASGSQGNLAALRSIAAGQPVTIADAGRIYGRGVMCPQLVGTAEDIADELAAITTTTEADGFIISPAFLPETFEDFVSAVVPILQQRGQFRRDYDGATLRDNLAAIPAALAPG
jgi:alkanesulfonate monooxygenase SsuD/methylene tetrahydromethanopterin reductase-like flavin-dependent oxidoreductase (luciferase family)